jgi:alpha-tubulin suppressor-like RCC1 family protein
VGTFSDAVDVAAGSKHTCVVKTDSTVWCWGLNDKGQLGNNTTTNSETPVQAIGT